MSRVLVSLAVFLAATTAAMVSPPMATATTENGGNFVSTSYTRLMDTNAVGEAPLGSQETRTFQVLGKAGIPSTGVGAVVIDIAATSATASDGYLTAWKAGTPRPSWASIRFGEGSVPRSNTVVVAPSAAGQISVFNGTGTTDFNIDVQGYFTDGSDGLSPGGFLPIEPAQVLGTGVAIGAPLGQLKPGASLDVQVTGVGSIPDSVGAVFANVMVSYPDSDGYLKIFPPSDPTPSRPILNYSVGGQESSGFTIPVSSDGKIRVLNSPYGTDVHVRIDVQGYFSESLGDGGGYTPLTSSNLFDSTPGSPLQPGESRNIVAGGRLGIPENAAAAVLLTVIAKNYTGDGHVAVDGAGYGDPHPTGVNVAFHPREAGLPNASTSAVRVGYLDEITIHNASNGTVDVLLNTQGWFSYPPSQEEDPADLGAPDADEGTAGLGTITSSGEQTYSAYDPSPAGCWGQSNNPHKSKTMPGYTKGYAKSYCQFPVVSLGVKATVWRKRWWGWQQKGEAGTGTDNNIRVIGRSGRWKGCDTNLWRTVGNHWSLEVSGKYSVETINKADINC